MSETTTKAKRQQQSTEELRASMQAYAEFLEQCKKQGMGPDDRVLFYDPEKVTPRDMIRFHELKIRPLQPRRPAGRPRKQSDDKVPARNTRALNPELAQLAYQMSQRKMHWKVIAQACYPKKTSAERRTDAMRKHIDRLVDRGGILARQKLKNLDAKINV